VSSDGYEPFLFPRKIPRFYTCDPWKGVGNPSCNVIVATCVNIVYRLTNDAIRAMFESLCGRIKF
jgi:hypothetical protein